MVNFKQVNADWDIDFVKGMLAWNEREQVIHSHNLYQMNRFLN